MNKTMKLGILDAVPSRFLHVDENISDGEKFIDLLRAVNLKAELVVYNVADGEFPDHVDDCDAYLFGGSPLGVYDDEAWIGQLLDFACSAHATRKRMVGICFGHQVIAQALGGEVMKSQNGWMLGLYEFDILEKPAWMEPDIMSSSLYHANKDQVMSLPPGARHIGRSEACQNAMYTVGDHILSIQGHPEQPIRAINNFIRALGDAVPPDVVASARRSFENGEPDKMRVGGWIRRFLER